MPNTADTEDLSEKKLLQIFVEVVDKPEILVGVYSSPPMVNEDSIDHILVSLNKANPAVAKALAESDHNEIMRQVNFTLIHDMCRWSWHYPLAAIRRHVWKEAGKTREEMNALPGFFRHRRQTKPAFKGDRRFADFWRQSRARPVRRTAPP